MHEDIVESIVMTNDEKLLFSGSLDKHIGVWSLEKYYKICYLKCDLPIRTLVLSNDNDFLIGICHN